MQHLSDRLILLVAGQVPRQARSRRGDLKNAYSILAGQGWAQLVDPQLPPYLRQTLKRNSTTSPSAMT